MKRTPLLACSLLVILAALVAGCAPRVHGATAIQPSQPGDTPAVWIYLQTSDKDEDGVYRCYDADQKPICKRARLVSP